MRHTLFITVSLLSSVLLQASPLGFECPCKQTPKPPKVGSQFYQLCLGCGCGAGGSDTDEIPPYQD